MAIKKGRSIQVTNPNLSLDFMSYIESKPDFADQVNLTEKIKSHKKFIVSLEQTLRQIRADDNHESNSYTDLESKGFERQIQPYLN